MSPGFFLLGSVDAKTPLTDYRFPFDEEILLAINRLEWTWLDAVWVAASSRTFGVGIAVLFGLWLLMSFKRRAVRPVLQGTIAALLADALGHWVLKPMFHRMRPNYAMPKDVLVLFTEASATGPSLPSLHAATSFAFAVGLGLGMPASFRIVLPTAAIISLSRLGVGVHWPSDVVMGALYGSLVGLLIHGAFGLKWRQG